MAELAEYKGDASDRTTLQVQQSSPRPGPPSACASGHATQKLVTSRLGGALVRDLVGSEWQPSSWVI